MNSYRDLIVWQKSFKLVIEIYKLTSIFPKSELYGIANQMRRASISVPSNIAEGYSRKYRKEYIQFISIAFSSGAELQTQLLLARVLELAPKEKFNTSFGLLEEVMKMLNALSKSLNPKP